MNIEPLTDRLQLLVRNYGLADVLHALTQACEACKDTAGAERQRAWAVFISELYSLRDLAAAGWAARGEDGPPLYLLPEPPDAGPHL